MAGVDEEGEKGEMELLVVGSNAERHLGPHNGEREDGQRDSQHPVDPGPEPHLPVPLWERVGREGGRKMERRERGEIGV